MSHTLAHTIYPFSFWARTLDRYEVLALGLRVG